MKIHFPRTGDEQIFLQLRSEVNEVVDRMAGSKKKEIVVKAFLFPLLYVAVYLAALFFGGNSAVYFVCYFFMGVLLVLNFLNLIHEAVHQNLFANKWINQWYTYFFDLMGANSYIWRLRHIRLHHSYPNILGWDSDIEQSPLARIFPHGRFYSLHKYQHIYLPLIYPFYLLNWLLVRDFKDFFSKKRMVHRVTTIPRIEYVKLFLFKALFLFYTLFLPMLILNISFGKALVGFLLMMFTASIIALLVLLSAHVNMESQFPNPDADGNMPTSWFLHQLVATNDIAEDNWFIRFFMGSFNYHVAHHLFPNINHVYYPYINPILEKYAREHGLPYRKFPLVYSLKGHYQLLKKNRLPENIFEETM